MAGISRFAALGPVVSLLICSGCDQSYFSGSASGVAGAAPSAASGSSLTGTMASNGAGPDMPAGGSGAITYPGVTGNPAGILNGHFDLDTSRQVYPFGQGTTDHHVHEYDKIYMTTSIDFFNLLDPGFDEIQSTIPSASTRFFLLVTNAQLSTGGVLEINGVSVHVLDFQNQVRSALAGAGALQIYTLGVPQNPGDAQLTSLRLGFDPNILSQGGLVPTDTPCVRANDAGLNGEYRNGALTVQALDATGYGINASTESAALSQGGLLWESTVFWHWTGPCYGQSAAAPGPMPPAPAAPPAPPAPAPAPAPAPGATP